MKPKEYTHILECVEFLEKNGITIDTHYVLGTHVGSYIPSEYRIGLIFTAEQQKKMIEMLDNLYCVICKEHRVTFTAYTGTVSACWYLDQYFRKL